MLKSSSLSPTHWVIGPIRAHLSLPFLLTNPGMRLTFHNYFTAAPIVNYFPEVIAPINRSFGSTEQFLFSKSLLA